MAELTRAEPARLEEALCWVQANNPEQPANFTHRILAAEVLALRGELKQVEVALRAATTAHKAQMAEAKAIAERAQAKLERRSGGEAGTKKDTDDQRQLRQVVAQEIEAVMHKHGVGGVMFLCSQDSAAWRFVIPKWSLLQLDNVGCMRFRGNTRTPEARSLVESTLHYIVAVRDMSTQCGKMYSDLFDCVESALPPGSVKTSPFRGFGIGGSSG